MYILFTIHHNRYCNNYIFDMKRIKFTDNLYQIEHTFLVGDYSKASNYILSKFDVHYELPESTGGLAIFLDGQSSHIIWLEELDLSPKLLSLLAHETLHATFDILGSRGIEYTPENHEPFAYYQQYLIDTFLTKFTK